MISQVMNRDFSFLLRPLPSGVIFFFWRVASIYLLRGMFHVSCKRLNSVVAGSYLFVVRRNSSVFSSGLADCSYVV